MRLEGSVVRTAEGSEVYCSCDGTAQTRAHSRPTEGFLRSGETYAFSVYPQLLPARAACLEYRDGDRGPQTLVAYGGAAITQEDLDSGNGPSIALVPLEVEGDVERFDVPVRHVGGADDPYLAGRQMHAFVDDQGEHAFSVAIGLEESSSARQGDSEGFNVAWVPGAGQGTPVLTLLMEASQGAVGWSLLEGPLDFGMLPRPIQIHAPPGLSMTTSGDQRTLHITGTSWAQDYFIVTTRGGAGYWWWRIPAGLEAWELPTPPDDGAFPATLEASFAGAYRYDRTPPADDMLEVWWDVHLQEMSWVKGVRLGSP